MVNYTPISLLPYPAMSDPPNGPDQLQQLARAVEPRLVNRFKNAVERNTRVTAPTLGMTTFRDDDKVYEFWNGTRWVGATQSIAVSSRTVATTQTNKNFTTTESAPQQVSTVKLVNPSSTYRMMWTAYAHFYIQITWGVSDLYSATRHYVQVNDEPVNWKNYSQYSYGGSGGTNFAGTHPIRTGFIEPGGNVSVSTWVTIEKANTVAGTLTLTACNTELTVTGVTTA